MVGPTWGGAVLSPGPPPRASAPRGNLQVLARQSFVGFDVLVARPGDDLVREPGCGRRFVPIQGFEVIAEELFVEARLAAARLVLVGRPETGRVGCQRLVNENQSSFIKAEFKFRVGDEDPAPAGVAAGGLVNLQAEVTDLFGDVRAEQLRGLLEGN